MSKRASNINLCWDKRNSSSELATLIPDYFFHQKKQFLACDECIANGVNFCEAHKNLKLFHYHLSPCNQPYHTQKLKETPSFNISITSGNRLHTLRKGKGKRPSPCKWLASFNNLLPYAGWFRDHFLHLPWIRYFIQVKTSRPHLSLVTQGLGQNSRWPSFSVPTNFLLFKAKMLIHSLWTNEIPEKVCLRESLSLMVKVFLPPSSLLCHKIAPKHLWCRMPQLPSGCLAFHLLLLAYSLYIHHFQC